MHIYKCNKCIYNRKCSCLAHLLNICPTEVSVLDRKCALACIMPEKTCPAFWIYQRPLMPTPSLVLFRIFQICVLSLENYMQRYLLQDNSSMKSREFFITNSLILPTCYIFRKNLDAQHSYKSPFPLLTDSFTYVVHWIWILWCTTDLGTPLGVLYYMLVCITVFSNLIFLIFRRDLIWYCSIPEDDSFRNLLFTLSQGLEGRN